MAHFNDLLSQAKCTNTMRIAVISCKRLEHEKKLRCSRRHQESTMHRLMINKKTEHLAVKLEAKSESDLVLKSQISDSHPKMESCVRPIDRIRLTPIVHITWHKAQPCLDLWIRHETIARGIFFRCMYLIRSIRVNKCENGQNTQPFRFIDVQHGLMASAFGHHG